VGCEGSNRLVELGLLDGEYRIVFLKSIRIDRDVISLRGLSDPNGTDTLEEVDCTPHCRSSDARRIDEFRDRKLGLVGVHQDQYRRSFEGHTVSVVVRMLATADGVTVRYFERLCVCSQSIPYRGVTQTRPSRRPRPPIVRGGTHSSSRSRRAPRRSCTRRRRGRCRFRARTRPSESRRFAASSRRRHRWRSVGTLARRSFPRRSRTRPRRADSRPVRRCRRSRRRRRL